MRQRDLSVVHAGYLVDELLRKAERCSFNSLRHSALLCGAEFQAEFTAETRYYPWLLPMNILREGRATTAIVLGVAGGLMAMLIGCFDFVRRDVLS
jgi:hypothetical protein